MGKFGVFINDDEDPMWESENEAPEVDQVVITNARGEVTTIGSSPGDTWVRIRINERAQVETYLGQTEAIALQERRDKFEQEPEGLNTDAYVKADPETGAPTTSDNAATPENQESELATSTAPDSQEDQEKENAMVGDVEF